MTPFEDVLLILATICVVILVILAVRLVRFLDHLDRTITRFESDSLPAIGRLSSILGRLDSLTEELETAYRSTWKQVDDLGLSPLLRLLKWIPFRTGMGPLPLRVILKAAGAGARAFRSAWGGKDKDHQQKGPSPPGSAGKQP
ncbi:MAG: hypothetical protein ACYC9S_08600 [Leptospirales bacterium]